MGNASRVVSPTAITVPNGPEIRSLCAAPYALDASRQKYGTCSLAKTRASVGHSRLGSPVYGLNQTSRTPA